LKRFKNTNPDVALTGSGGRCHGEGIGTGNAGRLVESKRAAYVTATPARITAYCRGAPIRWFPASATPGYQAKHCAARWGHVAALLGHDVVVAGACDQIDCSIITRYTENTSRAKEYMCIMDWRLLQANELGIRLEIVAGLPIWEPQPVLKHQRAVDRIRASIATMPPEQGQDAGCGCVHAGDVYISFPDGSLKRPDISIFCREPDEDDEAITLVPEAVIEIISKGYEAKDLEIGPQFYLAQGVKDVVVFNPYTLLVLHIRRDRVNRMTSPVTIDLECGCRCTA
jgi:Uma2 family endonuclease